jgi:hypothetical protein
MDPTVFKMLNAGEDLENIVECCRDQVATEMKCRKLVPAFKKYDNTMQFSTEITDGFLKDKLDAILFIAPTQFGKTATVFWTAFHLMTHPDPKHFIPFPHVFLISGLNSNSWKEQTQQRVLPCMRENVWHNKDLGNIENIGKLKDCILSKHNVLIIIDEVHVGSKISNVIFKTFLEIHPESHMRDISQIELFDFLFENQVKFIFVSATPDAVKECLVGNWSSEKFREIIACPESAKTYTWHKHYMDAGRVHDSFRLDAITPSGKPFHDELANRISKYDTPLYHMIRFPMETKNAEVEKLSDLLKLSIAKYNIDATIVLWDAKHGMHTISKELGILHSSTPEDLLFTKPHKHVIFILKELFRVAQTMPINNVGILVDRFTNIPNDSTLSQSLIGRASGHNKHQFLDQIEIYTNVDAVKKYVKLWESGFDYGAVSGYQGYEIKTNKAGTRIIAYETMMGKEVVKKVKKIVTLDDDHDNFDTPEELDCKYIHECSLKKTKVVMKDYTCWDTHGRFKVIVSQKKGVYKLNPNVKEYLNL